MTDLLSYAAQEKIVILTAILQRMTLYAWKKYPLRLQSVLTDYTSDLTQTDVLPDLSLSYITQAPHASVAAYLI